MYNAETIRERHVNGHIEHIVAAIGSCIMTAIPDSKQQLVPPAEARLQVTFDRLQGLREFTSEEQHEEARQEAFRSLHFFKAVRARK